MKPTEQLSIFESYDLFSLARGCLWLALLAGFAFFLLQARHQINAKFPISMVEVHGNLYHTPQEEIKQVVLSLPKFDFFSVHLHDLQQELLRLPWISKAEVRRVWPGQVKIWLEEHVPLARWGNTGVMTTQAEVFYPDALDHLESLPVFFAQSHDKNAVYENYFQFLKQLKPMGLSLTTVEVMVDHGMKLTLDNGVVLMLGCRDHAVRLKRFLQAYRFQLKNQISEIAYIDLRYTNGIAIGWRSISSDTTK